LGERARHAAGPHGRAARPGADHRGEAPARPGASPGVLPAAPWAQPADLVVQELGSSLEHGLPEREAQRRLETYGPNRLRRTRTRSRWRILVDQFSSAIAALLVAAAIAAFAFDERIEGAAIAAVLVLNAAIGFLTERRAARSMEALRELGQVEATVRRGGSTLRLSASLLVPGDILVVDAGDILTADVRLIGGSRLQVDESLLTGESLPVDKDARPVAAEAPLGNRASMLFKGTAVARGSGEGVVVATGMSTELGRISSLVEAAESETTPLEKRLALLARRLISLTLAIATLVALALVGSGRGLYLAVETAIALAVATIPEGLPIVATVALARGMWRMARRNALVENLRAVETLGSTTILLTDKTGTLTENRMTAVELQIAGGRVRIEGTGLDLTGGFRWVDAGHDAAGSPELIAALRVGVLCNNAVLAREPTGQIRTVGDPTEVALLVAGAKAGLLRDELLVASPEVGEVAFDPDTRRMATLHRDDGALFAAIKGAPETVLPGCTSLGARDGSRPLGAAERALWLERADRMAASGERVLALASCPVDSAETFGFDRLELLGLIGLFDPPREGVREAIATCRVAGIRVVMVTGDHGATARTVAGAVGLVEPGSRDVDRFVDAGALPGATALDPDDTTRLLRASVIARATPRQKLDLIELHQRVGAVVAMTGDGVNDAPALKKADIGIAMGLRGTQVAREAADMVLKDDELGTIVVAVEQGRAIFANIRKFVVYLLACNVSEVLVVGLGALVPGPLPILPLQLLFLNLVTDVFPALALGVCEGGPTLLQEPPRDPGEPMLARRHWRHVFLFGAVMAASVLAALAVSLLWLGKTESQATTIAFLTLAMAQLWHVFSMRDGASAPVRNEITRNPWIWSALALCFALLLGAVHAPWLARVLAVTDPGASGWSMAVAFSLVPLAVGQLALLSGSGRSPARVEGGPSSGP